MLLLWDAGDGISAARWPIRSSHKPLVSIDQSGEWATCLAVNTDSTLSSERVPQSALVLFVNYSLCTFHLATVLSYIVYFWPPYAIVLPYVTHIVRCRLCLFFSVTCVKVRTLLES